MATGVQVWSITAASNDTADAAVNWQEGQAPASVNNSARAEMSSVAKWRDDNNGTLVTTGSTTAFTVTTTQGSTALVDGYTVAVKLHATADSSATFAPDGLTGKKIQLVAGTNLAGGELAAGTIQRFTYNSGSTAWLVNNPQALGSQSNVVATANITNAAVTYAKIQNETDQTVLGNFAGGAAAPSEYTLKGPSVSGSTLVFPFPPAASFKNLSIKVASNTTVTVAADYVSLATSNSSSVTTTPLGGTINFGTTGANALDAGAIASGTWYAIYGIGPSSTSTTTACMLASTSFTTPALPTGYDRAARIGAVVTSTSTAAQNLMGTWQFGRRAQYVVGLAQTTTYPAIASGTTTSLATPFSVARFVPTTASIIHMQLAAAGGTIVATGPTTAANASSMLSIAVSGTSMLFPASLLLETTTVSYNSNSVSNGLAATGWDDNI